MRAVPGPAVYACPYACTNAYELEPTESWNEFVRSGKSPKWIMQSPLRGRATYIHTVPDAWQHAVPGHAVHDSIACENAHGAL